MCDNEVKKNTYFISWLRAFAMLCIILCHLTQHAPHAIVRDTAMFFNIGVELFFIISGFCFGLQQKINSPAKWYARRAKRILVPYELFLGVLALIYLAKGMSFNAQNWLSCIFCYQGAKVGVLGAEQTWFMTTMMLCYLITPLFSAFWSRLGSVKAVRIVTLILCIFILPLSLFLFKSDSYFTIGHQIGFYLMAYIIGRDYRRINLSKKQIPVFISMIIVGAALRIAGKIYLDNTVVYNRLIVGYTHKLIAFGIFFLSAIVFANIKPIKLVNGICSISFEVYLCHYMFVLGPLPLMFLTNSWVLNSIIIIAVSFAFATVLHLINTLIQKKLLKSDFKPKTTA